MSLFPLVSTVSPAPQASELPMCRDVMWNFAEDKPVFRRGEPVIVEGCDAVAVWAHHALRTPRYRYAIFSVAYGSEHEELIGRSYTEDLKVAEAARYTREALVINPYISDVTNITTEFDNGLLTISCTLVTIYGEVSIRV